MASVTLLESAKLAQDDLVAGLIETVVTVNEVFQYLPFDHIDGNALAYNREAVAGDVMTADVGAQITAKNAATFAQVTSSLTTIIGDAEVNGLIQATRSGDGNDQKAIQIASKVKSCGRKYQDMMVNGTGAGPDFKGLLSLVADDQTITAGAGNNGGELTFELLDAMLDQITDKDGQVDFILMNARTRRQYMTLLRKLGGTGMSDIVTTPNGLTVPAYRGVPIFRNDWIPTNMTQGSSQNATAVLAGTFDDGSRQHGIAGLTAAKQSGITVKNVGEHHDRDESISRVVWYCGLALFNERGLACIKGLTP